MFQVSFCIEAPALFNAAGDDLCRAECFEELESEIPRMEDVWCFDLFEPYIRRQFFVS